jgi:predicted transcriptional regulator
MAHKHRVEMTNFFELGDWKKSVSDTYIFKGHNSLISPRRIELLSFILKNPDRTVTQLANELKRKKEAISRDLSLFEKHGLIHVEKRGREKGIHPKVKHIMISL